MDWNRLIPCWRERVKIEACANCDGEGWVCENHPEVPWIGGLQECCGGAGMPCSCNKASPPWHFKTGNVPFGKDE